jgi:hypothetical protein
MGRPQISGFATAPKFFDPLFQTEPRIVSDVTEPAAQRAASDFKSAHATLSPFSFS